MDRFSKRSPTRWSPAAPSFTSSRSVLVRVTTPDAACSASLALLPTALLAVYSGLGERKWTVSRGGNPPALSKESAVRWPVPVMMNASAFPLDQPGRDVTSCTSPARLGVRCVALDSPTLQAAGCQGTLNGMRGRRLIL